MPSLSQQKFELTKDQDGKFFINNEDSSGNHYTKELRLYSNCAETTVEIQTVTTVAPDNADQKNSVNESNPEMSHQKDDKDDTTSKDMNGLKKDRKIILKIDSIDIPNQTDEVIGKLRKLNKLIQKHHDAQ